jgi:hypothetical protein
MEHPAKPRHRHHSIRHYHVIKAREIQQKAHQEGVRDTQIEKDYILSWIMWGIASHKMLSTWNLINYFAIR